MTIMMCKKCRLVFEVTQLDVLIKNYFQTSRDKLTGKEAYFYVKKQVDKIKWTHITKATTTIIPIAQKVIKTATPITIIKSISIAVLTFLIVKGGKKLLQINTKCPYCGKTQKIKPFKKQ